MKKLFLALILCTFLISMVSAADWDNVKNFNENKPIKGEIEIKNLLGLGSTLATYTITSHTNECLIDCYSEGIATFYSNDKLFRNIKFYGKDNKEKTIPFKVYLQEDNIVNWNEDTYNNICSTSSNGTYSCNNIVNGSISKTRTDKVWVEYDGRTLGEGNYTWRIEAKKGATESIDWVGESFGVEFSEWAWWDASWSKKQQVLIQERTGNSWANYSVPLTITYDGDMKTDFTDLRFINSAETLELPYYVVTKTDSVTASVLVKLPLTANVNTTIYMYYGNALASSTSNANTTYLWYDDATTDRSSQYICSGATMTYSAANRNYNIIGTSGGWDGGCVFNGEQQANITTQAIMTRGTGYGGVMARWLDPTNKYRIDDFDGNTGRLSKDVGGVETHMVTTAYTYAVTTNMTLTIFGSTLNATLEPRGGTLVKYNAIDTALPNKGKFGFVEYAATSNHYYTNMTGRAYGSPEPSSVFGAEEINTGITIISSYPPSGSNFSTTSIGFGCNATSAGQNITSVVLNVTGNATWTESITGLNVNNYNATFTNTTLADGTYNWNCIGYGSAGINGSSPIRVFSKDTISPVITITSPTGSYYSENVSLNYSAVDTNRQACWYSLNGGSNVTIGSCANTTVILTAGNNSVRVYANDSFGNVGSSAIASSYLYPTLGLCNATLNTPFMNITFKDEITTTNINATASASISYYYGTDSGLTRILTFTNTSQNPSYNICAYPNYTSITSNLTFNGLSTGYPTRYFSSTDSLTNVTTNKTFYFLASADGLYQPFVVVNSAGTAISGATVSASYGLLGIVDSRTTDSNGQVTLWLDPNKAHVITASATGYPSNVQTVNPSTTSITIQLGATTTYPANLTLPSTEGISYTINPTNRTLYNGTAYDFQLVLTTIKLTIDRFNFTLYNSTNTAVASVQSLANGGTITTNYNVANNTKMTLRGYYMVNGTQNNVIRTWVVLNSQDTQYSILFLKNRIVTYLDSGFFGLTRGFGLNMFCFIVIFIIVGTFSWKYGISNEIIISAMTLFLVWLFEVGLGLIDMGANISLTFWVAIITVVLLIKEGLKVV